MTPYYADDWLTVYQGDCRAVMAEMEPESVHCVVTSPPYWGLRDYGTATWVGGDDGCPHRVPATGSTMNKGNNNREGKPFDVVCGLCGAIRVDSQLGLEPTPEAYVENMVAVFREVRRVLRSDGTVWLNLGDSYAAGGERSTGRNDTDRETPGGRGGSFRGGERRATGQRDGLKPKDLVGIPWRVAFALQADGWYLRSDIIWAKPNPMPESVTDRPTKAHEYLFLLSKSPRYYFDADAVREPHTESTLTRVEYGLKHRHPDNVGVGIPPVDTERMGERFANPAGRNIRSVWTIATQPYPGAHFATFPQALVEPCVKAGSSEKGVCPECGAPWQRVLDVSPLRERDDSTRDPGKRDARRGMAAVPEKGWETTRETTGWRPPCRHDAEPVPATVLDPFAGSGTTGLVAQRLSRRAVLIDLSTDYLAQLMDRNRDIPLGLGA